MLSLILEFYIFRATVRVWKLVLIEETTICILKNAIEEYDNVDGLQTLTDLSTNDNFGKKNFHAVILVLLDGNKLHFTSILHLSNKIYRVERMMTISHKNLGFLSFNSHKFWEENDAMFHIDQMWHKCWIFLFHI